MERIKRKDDNISVTVLVEAKKLYTEQLTNLLYPQLYKGIVSIYQLTKTSDNPLELFQEKLKDIPKWSDEILSKEYTRIIQDSDCDWYDDLITAVFISHVKVLSSVRLGKKEKPIELKVPNAKNFIHKCYIECARKFYENPFLLEDRQDKIDYIQIQTNLQKSYDTITLCIKNTIEKLLPTRYILQQYLSEPDTVSSESDTDLASSDPNYDIKKLVRKELQNFIESESDHGSRHSSKHNSREHSPERNIEPDIQQPDNVSEKEIKEKRQDQEFDILSNTYDKEIKPDLDIVRPKIIESEPVTIAKEHNESEVKDILVPASKKIQEFKKAEQTLLPEIKEHLKENPNLKSDTLFLSDDEK